MKSRDKARDRKYDSYVEHPLYGRRPRHTGLNPNPCEPDALLHSNATNIHEIQKRTQRVLGKKLGFLSQSERMTPKELPRIPGTAIKADPARQNMPTVPVTHYCDVERVCRNCQRPFIFFAEEQRYWYEELRFPLDADCVRCAACRKTERFLARCRATYEKLVIAQSRDWKDNLKMAQCALTLIEQGLFHERALQRVRTALKAIPDAEHETERYQGLIRRLRQLSAMKR